MNKDLIAYIHQKTEDFNADSTNQKQLSTEITDLKRNKVAQQTKEKKEVSHQKPKGNVTKSRPSLKPTQKVQIMGDQKMRSTDSLALPATTNIDQNPKSKQEASLTYDNSDFLGSTNKDEIIKTISKKIKDCYLKSNSKGSYEHKKIMKDLGSMDLDDETYKDIIDKVGIEINEILNGMKHDKNMKQKFINEIYNHSSDEEGGHNIDELCEEEQDSPIDEYYNFKDLSEKSRRLQSSSDHSHSNIKHTYREEDKEYMDSEEMKDGSTSKTSQSKEYIGAHSFTAHELLGTGSFGEVYLVEKISDSTLHAMKVL